MRSNCARNSAFAKEEVSTALREHAADAGACFGCPTLRQAIKNAAGENTSGHIYQFDWISRPNAQLQWRSKTGTGHLAFADPCNPTTS